MSRADPPARIVCLTEEPTEILHLLGEAERVVGISAFTVRPPGVRERYPVVSGFQGGNVAKIVSLRPDLVIGFSDIQADLARRLIAENLQVLIFNQRSVAEILEVILLLGRLVGREERARELVRGYEADLERRRQRNEGRGPRVYFEEWPEPMICGIRWVSELIEIAGGIDVFSARSRDGKGARARVVSSEDVLAARPEVIVASWCGKKVDADAIAARPGWEDTPAVAAGRIFEIDSSLILQPGPACLTDGLEALERCLAGPTTARP